MAYKIKHGSNGSIVHCSLSNDENAISCKIRTGIPHAYYGNFDIGEIPEFDVKAKNLGTFKNIYAQEFYTVTRGSELILVPDPAGRFDLECKVEGETLHCGET